MKHLILFISLFTSLSFVQAKDLEAYAIYTSEGKKTDFDKLVKTVDDHRFVFFGELHNNPISHWLQFELTKKMYGIYKNRVMLGAEMFEADNQYIIDEYLADKISSKSFQDEVRLWPNYNTDYKPLLEFAKEKNLQFIATNIPRRYASMCYKQGLDSLFNLGEEAQRYIAPLKDFEFDSTVNCYRTMIHEFGSHGGVNIAIAQAIKDATMAHFILANVEKRHKFIHFNGSFHSDNHEGIIHYLKKEVKDKEIMNITTVLQADIDKLEEQYLGKADFIICVPETMTTTH